VELSVQDKLIWVVEKTAVIKLVGGTGAIIVGEFPLESLLVEHPKKMINDSVINANFIITIKFGKFT